MTGSRGLSAWAVLAYAFLLAPIAVLILASLSPQPFLTFPPQGISFRWYEKLAHDPAFTGSLVVSLVIGAAVSVLAVALGGAAALAIERGRFPGRGILSALLVSPIVFPTVLLGLAYLQFFNQLHLQGTFVAFIAAHLTLTVPYTARAATAALTRSDRNLEDAARSLGASPFATVRLVTIPQIRPGLVVGLILAFIVSFNDLPVALFISGPDTTTLPIRVYTYVQYTNDPTIAALSTVLVAVLLVGVLAGEWRFGLSRYLTQLD